MGHFQVWLVRRGNSEEAAYQIVTVSVDFWLLCPWDFPARILEWVAISSSRELSHPGIELEFLMSPALAAPWESPIRICPQAADSVYRKPVKPSAFKRKISMEFILMSRRNFVLAKYFLKLWGFFHFLSGTSRSRGTPKKGGCPLNSF